MYVLSEGKGRTIYMSKFYDAITDFLFIEDHPRKADMIFIPGGGYGEIAINGAALYNQGYAQWIMPSGGHSILKERFEGAVSPQKYVGKVFQAECDFLSEILIDEGVPDERILREKNASFTYENAIYSRKMVDDKKLTIHTALISCQAYHARRCLMYYQLLFPETTFYICPIETKGMNRDNWQLHPDTIDIVLDELSRCGSQFHKIMREQIALYEKNYLK